MDLNSELENIIDSEQRFESKGLKLYRVGKIYADPKGRNDGGLAEKYLLNAALLGEYRVAWLELGDLMCKGFRHQETIKLGDAKKQVWKTKKPNLREALYYWGVAERMGVPKAAARLKFGKAAKENQLAEFEKKKPQKAKPGPFEARLLEGLSELMDNLEASSAKSSARPSSRQPPIIGPGLIRSGAHLPQLQRHRRVYRAHLR